ncbi:MAG: YbhB/YbcL family Raf kinase inhibitor-like protein [Candidatus Bathyarchaeota archaeon]|nr:YbhB/YbcL family Raf kinase inhibitor-like protein [Candidatus Bathyarchaeota archaeon]
MIVIGLLAASSLSNFEPTLSADASGSLTVTSTAFSNGSTISIQYTGDGENINPPIKIEGISQGTQSLVLIVDDPILPFLTWNHWVMWNIPVDGVIDEDSAPGVVGRNGWSRNTYGGPDPPFGTHTYHFKAYAIDIVLNFHSNVGKTEILEAINGHVLAKGELCGTYP